MDETGVANVADPLGGSWYVEALTDEMERQAEEIFTRIKDMSPDGTITQGILRGIEDGWFQGEIADSSFRYQTAVEKGEKKIVGVNTLTDSVEGELEVLRISHEVEREQKRVLGERRAARDDDAVQRALKDLAQTARGEGNTVPPMLDAVRAEATLGEICDALRDLWGEYVETARY
jgi:methylmalonyl-CoA mutase N-terminal domain/subunit